MNATWKIGDKAKFSTTHSDGSIITYSAKLVKLDGSRGWFEVPERVRNLPFPPLGGKRYGLYPLDQCCR